MKYRLSKDTIDHYFRLLNHFTLNELQRPALVAKATYYDTYGQRPDSAEFYWTYTYRHHLIDVFDTNEVAKELYRFYTRHGQPAKALEYAKVYIETEDSINRSIELQQTANAYNQYVYRKDQVQEKRQERRIRWLVLGLAATGALAVGLGIALHQRRKAVQRAQKRNETLQDDLQRLQRQLDEERALREREQQKSERDAFYTSEVMGQLLDYVSKGKKPPIHSPIWKDFIQDMDQYEPELAQRIANSPYQKDLIMRLTAYLKHCRFKNVQIAQLLSLSTSTVSRRLEKLKEALGLDSLELERLTDYEEEERAEGKAKDRP